MFSDQPSKIKCHGRVGSTLDALSTSEASCNCNTDFDSCNAITNEASKLVRKVMVPKFDEDKTKKR